MSTVDVTLTSPSLQDEVLSHARQAMEPVSRRVVVVEDDKVGIVNVERYGVGPLETQHGRLYQFAFLVNDIWRDYIVVVKCDGLDAELQPVFKGHGEILLRTDSGCQTGQVFHDLTCDCAEQLHLSIERIGQNERGGVIVHVPRQDGRGLGLAFKLSTLILQDALEIDTVQASSMLDPEGVTRDVRTYAGVVAILRFLGISEGESIGLLSNNPRKLAVFADNGYANVELRSVTVAPTKYTERHLLAKQRDLGHIGLIEPPQEGGCSTML